MILSGFAARTAASRLGLYPSFWAVVITRFSVSGEQHFIPRRSRETIILSTPAARATSEMLGLGLVATISRRIFPTNLSASMPCAAAMAASLRDVVSGMSRVTLRNF